MTDTPGHGAPGVPPLPVSDAEIVDMSSGTPRCPRHPSRMLVETAPGREWRCKGHKVLSAATASPANLGM